MFKSTPILKTVKFDKLPKNRNMDRKHFVQKLSKIVLRRQDGSRCRKNKREKNRSVEDGWRDDASEPTIL